MNTSYLVVIPIILQLTAFSSNKNDTHTVLKCDVSISDKPIKPYSLHCGTLNASCELGHVILMSIRVLILLSR